LQEIRRVLLDLANPPCIDQQNQVLNANNGIAREISAPIFCPCLEQKQQIQHIHDAALINIRYALACIKYTIAIAICAGINLARIERAIAIAVCAGINLARIENAIVVAVVLAVI
jgi:hypothetical protein